MAQTVELATTTAFAVVALLLIRLRYLSVGLTMRSAWRWAMVAVIVNLAAVMVRFLPTGTSPNINSALHYLAAVLMLTPFVDVLGARNPGHKAWPLFVVLPMIVVLQWPAVSQLMSERAEQPIAIPTPTIIGFLFVLVMGAGNYFGTRNTMATMLTCSAVVCQLLPVTEWVTWPNHGYHLAAGILTAVACVLVQARFSTHGPDHAFQSSETATANVEPPDAAASDSGCNDQSQLDERTCRQLWTDFRDLFGIVWAKRVMDRVNQFGSREHWKVELTLDGFEPLHAISSNVSPDENSTPTDLERPVQVLKWVLRRFASDEFFARYGMRGLQSDEQKTQVPSAGPN